MMRTIKKGATGQSIYFDVFDNSSTTGGRKTGLVYNTSNLTAYYIRNQGSPTAITLADLAAANSSWISGGFKEVDATNMPGLYRLDVPDAAFATGADSVIIMISGATGMVQSAENIQLVDNLASDIYSRLGVPAGASVSADIATVAGYVDTEVAAIKAKTDNLPSDPADASDIAAAFVSLGSAISAIPTTTLDAAGVRSAVGLASANLDAQLGALPTSSDLATALAGADDATLSAIAALNNVSAADVRAQADAALSNVGLTTTVTARIDVDVSSRLAAADYTAPDNTDVLAATTSIYDRIGAPAGASIAADIAALGTGGSAPSAADIRAEIDANSTQLAAIKGKTDNLPSDPADESLVIAATDAIMARIGSPAGASVSADIAAVKSVGDAVKAKTDNLPAAPAAAGDAMTLTAAYDAAKTSATQTSVDDLPTNAELTAALDGLATATAVDAIKAKTDSLTFTKSGEVDANIQSVNDVTVAGVGSSGAPWGPA